MRVTAPCESLRLQRVTEKSFGSEFQEMSVVEFSFDRQIYY